MWTWELPCSLWCCQSAGIPVAWLLTLAGPFLLWLTLGSFWASGNCASRQVHMVEGSCIILAHKNNNTLQQHPKEQHIWSCIHSSSLQSVQILKSGRWNHSERYLIPFWVQCFFHIEVYVYIQNWRQITFWLLKCYAATTSHIYTFPKYIYLKGLCTLKGGG